MTFMESGLLRGVDIRSRSVWDVLLPQWCIGDRGSDVNSVMVESLLFALRECLARLNVQDIFDDIFQGKVPGVYVATSRVPSFGNNYENPVFGYRCIGLLSKFSPALVPAPPQIDRNAEIVSMDSSNSTSEYQAFSHVWAPFIPSPQLHFILIFFTPQKSFSASKTHITDSSRESSPLSDSLRQDNSSLARSESPFNYILANHSSSAGSGQVNEGQGTFTLDQNSAAMAFVPMPAYNDLLNLDQCLDVRPSHDNGVLAPTNLSSPFPRPYSDVEHDCQPVDIESIQVDEVNYAPSPANLTFSSAPSPNAEPSQVNEVNCAPQPRKSHFLLSPVTERRAVASQRNKLRTQSRKSHFLLSPVTERRAVADEHGRRGAESGV